VRRASRHSAETRTIIRVNGDLPFLLMPTAPLVPPTLLSLPLVLVVPLAVPVPPSAFVTLPLALGVPLLLFIPPAVRLLPLPLVMPLPLVVPPTIIGSPISMLVPLVLLVPPAALAFPLGVGVPLVVFPPPIFALPRFPVPRIAFIRCRTRLSAGTSSSIEDIRSGQLRATRSAERLSFMRSAASAGAASGTGEAKVVAVRRPVRARRKAGRQSIVAH
jgi:hypothetical protein